MTGSWVDIAGFIKEQGSCAIVTVVELFGSGPREIGARLIVAPDGAFTGTIGGGTLEWQALAKAQALLPATSSSMSEHKYGLGPDLGQCCGGHVTLCFETLRKRDFVFARKAAKAESSGPIWVESRITDGEIKRQIIDEPDGETTVFDYDAGCSLTAKFGKALTPVYVFGAGHVGTALVAILKTLPMRVVWLDSRDIESKQDLPSSVIFEHPQNPVAEIKSIPDNAYVFVLTHSHALDLDLCMAALMEDRFSYVGVIGSKTKKVRFEKRLRDAGITEPQMALFHSPLGLGTIRGKDPSVIAVSIAADLVQRIEQAEINETTIEGETTVQERYRESN